MSFSNEIQNSNEWILDRTFKEFYQKHGSKFGSQSENGAVASSGDDLRSETVFELFSQDNAYLDVENMYFQGYFQSVITDNADAEIKSNFDVGGIASMIDEVEVELGNNKLERITEYGKLNSAISMMTDSPNYVDYNLMKQGDSMGDYYYDKLEENRSNLELNELSARYFREGNTGVFQPIGITPAETRYTHAVGAFYPNRELRLSDPVGGNNGDAIATLRAGDLLLLWNDTTKVVLYAEVAVQPTDNNYVQITEGSAISAFRNTDHNVIALASEQFDEIWVIDGNDLNYISKKSTRARAMNQGPRGVKLTFKLRLESLSVMKRIPLPILKKKLRITIRWKDPRIGMKIRDADDISLTNKWGYVMEDIRIVAPMLEVSYEDMERHRALLRNGFGYKYKSYDHYQQEVSRTAVNTVLNFKSKAISVRHVLFVLTDTDYANNPYDVGTQNHASNSTFYKNFLERVRVRIGQSQYPRYGDINTNDLFSSEMLEFTKMSLTGSKEFDNNLRVLSYDWQNQDSEKFVCAVPIAITDEHLEGRDVSDSLIELRLRFAGTPANLTNDAMLHMWVSHDKVLYLQETSSGLEVRIAE